MLHKRHSRSLSTALVETSPLRRFDPRVKLAMALCASLSVMLPLPGLAIFIACFALLLAWGRLLPSAASNVWRMRWFLLVLFLLDYFWIGPELALAIVLRLSLLAASFSLLVATTTPGEFNQALESLHLPYRYAFSLGLAFQSLGLLEEEWRNILEAQRSRGLLNLEWRAVSWRQAVPQVIRQARDLVALSVPAIVLTTKRAWGITESAYARGFDSPHRRPYRRLHMRAYDWLVLVAVVAIIGIIVIFS
jgi:energy-coupling factor transport system permease protein